MRPFLALLGVLLATVAVWQLLLASRISFSSKGGNHDVGQGQAAGSVTEALCFIVRTYWGHGEEGDGSKPLVKMLKTLSATQHTKWDTIYLSVSHALDR